MAGVSAREIPLLLSRRRDFLRYREPVIEKNLNEPASLPFFQHPLGFERVEDRCRPSLCSPGNERKPMNTRLLLTAGALSLGLVFSSGAYAQGMQRGGMEPGMGGQPGGQMGGQMQQGAMGDDMGQEQRPMKRSSKKMKKPMKSKKMMRSKRINSGSGMDSGAGGM
jgi:periplasmic protein CpxP/Spy